MASVEQSRSAIVRQEQAGVDLDEKAVASAFYAFLDEMLTEHGEHPWHQVGRCVYCGPCHTRLYQGTLPEDHPVWKPPRKPTAADKMREKWGKS